MEVLEIQDCCWGGGRKIKVTLDCWGEDDIQMALVTGLLGGRGVGEKDGTISSVTGSSFTGYKGYVK